MPTKIEKDDVTGVMTTGHEWDGLKELNNPLPSWWLWLFWATIVFSVIYMVLYPAIPIGGTATPGILGHSDRLAVVEDIERARADQGVFLERIETSDVGAIAQDAELLNFAMVGGESAFLDNCAACHGTGATGGPGYPSLQDDAWIWGGSVEAIHQTILHGVRWAEDDLTRFSDMPAYGDFFSAEEIQQVSAYTLSLSGSPHDADLAAAGEQLYLDNCAACHMEDGSGMADLGAPRLNDQVWLYGGEMADVVAQVTNPQHGVMPAFVGRLEEATLKMLAVYVHSLGGGEASP